MTLAAAVATSALTLLALSPWLDAPLADASQGEAFPDSDGDFLADVLEFATLSDPASSDTDQDGIGDYMATVRHLSSDPRAGQAGIIDHEMRVLMSAEPRSDGTRAIWLHFLFRFAGDTLPTFEQFRPFVDWRGAQWPLEQVFGYGQIHLNMRQDPIEGLLVHAAVEIGSEDDLRFIIPHQYTFGAVASIDGKRMTRGVFVQTIDGISGDAGVFSTLVPVGASQVAFQVLSEGDAENPFWASDRICILTFEVFSSGTSGHTCQVVEASCDPLDARVKCPPSCPQTVGSMLHFPGGITTIVGGG